MNLERRLIYVQSWWLASELIRRTPGLGIIETHPGGGLYDCLSVIRWGSQQPESLAHLTRDGTIHVGDDLLPRITWEQDRQAEDRHHSVKLIESRAGLEAAGQAARTTAPVLVGRIAYQLLLTSLNDKKTWDVRNVRVDTRGYGNGEGDVIGFPSAEAAVTQRREDDPWGDSRYRFWHVLKGEQQVGVLDNDGLLHLRDREPVDLMALYRSCGRSITQVAAQTHDVLDRS